MASPELNRILFVAENVTTAQVSRLATLARALPEDRFEVVFACADFHPVVFANTRFERRRIHSLPREQILRAVAAGRQAYDATVLDQYLVEESRLLREVRPDLVVANFRPSLTISVPLAGASLATVINAHWSPYAVRDRFPVPDHPTVKMVGVDMARRFLSKALPTAFSLFAKPVNGLRKKHGLRPFGDLLKVMTWGDLTLYPDIPELAPTRGVPSTHHYLGAVDWSAPVAAPAWWDQLDPNRPIVYVTLGSSGSLEAWPALAAGLGELPVNVMLATAGRVDAARLPPNFWTAELLPGHGSANPELRPPPGGSAGASGYRL